MNNVSTDNLFCSRFEHASKALWKVDWKTNCYHVLGVSENFLAGHLAEVVHLQSAWLLHHVVVSIVGPEY